jgi:hypothetical protein
MSRPRKKKKPGDAIPLKLKDNESPHIVDWFNEQSTISQSLRYLIEKDISENGLRNISEEIQNSFGYYTAPDSIKTPLPAHNVPTKNALENETEIQIDNQTYKIPPSQPTEKNEVKNGSVSVDNEKTNNKLKEKPTNTDQTVEKPEKIPVKTNLFG